MTISSLLYAAGALLEGWIAAMLFIGGRALHTSGARWPYLLGLGFAFNALRTGLMAAGYGNVALDAAARPLTSLLAAVALGFVTASLISYVDVPRRLARRLNLASVLLLGTSLFGIEMQWLNRGQGQLIGIVFFVGWVLLFLQAMAREPRSGHGIVVAALMFYPIGAVAVRTGALPLPLMPAIEIVPLVAIGLTVLTTGLIRAHRRAQRETAEAAKALAAREHAEALLRAANETLEQRVALRTADLRETIEGLESFNRSVSHDLRGPLGGIAGIAQIARELVAKGDTAQTERLLAAIQKQADESVHLVASLLALARASEAQPRRSRFAAEELVQEVVSATAASAPAASNGDAAASPTPDIVVKPLPVVEADRDLLRQVFANLISNARKFAAVSGAPRVEIGHARTDKGDAFYVRDNGVGFSNADAQRMFKPFQRLHGARFEGFGIGLSIVRRIIDHHGGLIWAEGTPGQGATFWFTLGR